MGVKKYIAVVIWVFCLIGLDQFFGFAMSILAPKYKQDTRIEKLLNKQINADILVFGSSRALNNFSPNEIKKITGNTCYNLGFSGSNVLFHEEILKLALKHCAKPKLLIYNLDDYGTLYENSGISFRFDVLEPYVEHNEINEIVCEHREKYIWPTYLCRSYRHNSNFINSVRYLFKGKEDLDYLVSNIDSLGANLVPFVKGATQPSYIKQRVLPKSNQFNLSYLNSFKNIQKICIENNIKLVVCLPPLLMKPMVGFETSIKNLLEPNTILLDYATLFEEKPNYFLDPDHLNSEGAIVFSDSAAHQLIPILK
jgi:hypothetical protein